MRQRNITGEGFIQAAKAGPYPPFPADFVERLHWAECAPVAPTGRKCVLIVLARMADKSGRAWPKVETLAKRTSQSVRSTQSALRELEGRRWLVTVPYAGGYSTYYPKAPTERVCTGCGARCPDGGDICPECHRQTDLFQPAA